MRFLAKGSVARGDRSLIGLVFLLCVMLVYVLFAPMSVAQDDYVVSIGADSRIRTVRTTGGTVRDLLERAGIKLANGDLVEPGLDTEITGPVFNINVYRARPVLIHDGAKEVTIITPYASPRLIAKDAGIKVWNEDKLVLTRIDDFIGRGMLGEEMNIVRATAVKFDWYGKQLTIRTHAETVGELLAEKDIVPDKNDQLSPSPSTRLSAGDRVQLIRVGKKVVTKQEVVKFSVRTIWDDDMLYGTQNIEEAGVDGSRVVTYEITYHNGQEASRRELKSVVSEEPLTQVVRAGTKLVGGSDNKALGKTMAAARGWTGSEWICLLNLWDRESHWNNLAQNPISTAFGIAQFLDSTWAGTGYKKTSDPAIQIQAGLTYVGNRYGSPCGAWQHSESIGWY